MPVAVGRGHRNEKTQLEKRGEVMTNAKTRTWLIIWPLILVAMVMASCAHQNQSSAYGREPAVVNRHGSSAMNRRVAPTPASRPQAAQPAGSYYGNIGNVSNTPTYNGYQPNNVMPPKKFGYIDGVDRHPNPTAPRK
jgi:hypothetical protein